MQCLRNKISELEYLISLEKIDIICASEHWLTNDQVKVFVPNDFLVGDVMCRNKYKNGGTSVLIKNNIIFEKICLQQFVSELNFEICGIKLKSHNMAILSVYRSPKGDLKLFFENFEQSVKKILKCNGIRLAIGGDFNINLLEKVKIVKCF
jgi:hypothetical protein